MTGGTIVERLQAQRTLLVDVVRQLDTAITAFGGTVATNGNGTNGTTKNGGGSGSWWRTISPARKARIVRKILASKRQKRAEREAATFSE